MSNFRKKELAEDKYQEITRKGVLALMRILPQYFSKQIDLERISRIALLLIKSGMNKNNKIFSEIVDNCSLTQKIDGGWVGVEDSVWSTALLKEYENYHQNYTHGLEWLKTQSLDHGEWGKSIRDLGRIPLTGLLLYLLPELASENCLNWLEEKWKKDFYLNPKLTYKAAFLLMSYRSTGFNSVDVPIFNLTVNWLKSQQNEDHGWGPWKGHPTGSSPFCTGMALTGLLQYPESVDRKVIVNGLGWIEKNQLEDGLWADHFIEEGSAWCFYALTEGYKFLKGSQ